MFRSTWPTEYRSAIMNTIFLAARALRSSSSTNCSRRNAFWDCEQKKLSHGINWWIFWDVSSVNFLLSVSGQWDFPKGWSLTVHRKRIARQEKKKVSNFKVWCLRQRYCDYSRRAKDKSWHLAISVPRCAENFFLLFANRKAEAIKSSILLFAERLDNGKMRILIEQRANYRHFSPLRVGNVDRWYIST